MNGARVPAPAAPKAAPAGAKPFTNINRFHVPAAAAPAFEAAWRSREQSMRKHPGFVSLSIEKTNATTYVVKNTWASIPEWEAWSLSNECRRSHMPYVSIIRYGGSVCSSTAAPLLLAARSQPATRPPLSCTAALTDTRSTHYAPAPRPIAAAQLVWQFVPGKGEGFPEDFVPFLEYTEAVNAKY